MTQYRELGIETLGDLSAGFPNFPSFDFFLTVLGVDYECRST